MEILKNIDWNKEYRLEDNSDEVEELKEEGWVVAFTYNGYNLIAEVDYSISFDIDIEEGDRFTPGYKYVECSDVYLEIKSLYDNEYSDFKVDTKTMIQMEHELEIDLKIQY